MKRCIVCGNECEDKTRVCEICGNLFGEEDRGTATEDTLGDPNGEQESSDWAEDGLSFDEANEFGALQDMPFDEQTQAGMKSNDEAQPSESSFYDTESDHARNHSSNVLEDGLISESPAYETNGAAKAASEFRESERTVSSASEPGKEEKTLNSAEKAAEAGKSVNSASSPVAAGKPVSSASDSGKAEKAAASSSSQSTAQAAARQERHPRRMRSGPHIYGQDDNSSGMYQGTQGVIRKEVKAGQSVDKVPGNPPSHSRHGQSSGTVPAQGENAVNEAVVSHHGKAVNPSQKGRSVVPHNEANTVQPGARSVSDAAQIADEAGNEGGVQNGNHAVVRGARPADAAGRAANEAGNEGGNYDPVRSQNLPRANGGAAVRGGAMNPTLTSGGGNVRSIPAGNGDAMHGVLAGVRSQGGRSGGRSSSEDYSTYRMATAARKLLASPLFLLVVVLQTAYTAGSVAAIFTHQLNYSQIVRLLTYADIPTQLKGYAGSVQNLLLELDSGAMGFNLAIRIPDILFCLGLWLVWIMAHREKGKMSGAGFVLMKIVILINMIVSCAVLLLLLILSVTLVIATWGAGTKSMVIAAVIVLAAAIVVTMAVVMYYFCYLATIRTCRVNAVSGEQYGKASGYVAILHMLLALISVISILSGIVNMEIANIAAGVGGLGWRFLFGIWIFWYRSHMKEYNEG